MESVLRLEDLDLIPEQLQSHSGGPPEKVQAHYCLSTVTLLLGLGLFLLPTKADVYVS